MADDTSPREQGEPIPWEVRQGITDAVVKRLVDEIKEKEKQIQTLSLWVSVLAVICLVLVIGGCRFFNGH